MFRKPLSGEGAGWSAGARTGTWEGMGSTETAELMVAHFTQEPVPTEPLLGAAPRPRESVSTGDTNGVEWKDHSGGFLLVVIITAEYMLFGGGINGFILGLGSVAPS